MIYKHEIELERSARKLQHVCKVIKVVTYACLVCFLLFWCIFFAMLLVSYIETRFEYISFCNNLVFGIAIVAILFAIGRIFSDVAYHDSPFTKGQSRRLIIIAAMLAVLAVNDFLFPTYEIVGTELFSQNVGFEVATTGTLNAPTLNVGMLFFSILLLCLSVIFKYGYLLQRLNDDTV